jgi:hypothetical protein
MAASTNITLAARLTDHADSITNVAAHQLEMDLCEAAAFTDEREYGYPRTTDDEPEAEAAEYPGRHPLREQERRRQQRRLFY